MPTLDVLGYEISVGDRVTYTGWGGEARVGVVVVEHNGWLSLEDPRGLEERLITGSSSVVKVLAGGSGKGEES